MIYILVPTFDRVNDTNKFLDSLHQSIQEEYRVILIDDHPDKVTYKNIKQSNTVEILSSKKELWWVGSINLGIQNLFNNQNLLDEDIIVFANNDIQINKNCFDLLHEEIKKDIKQIVHPRTFDQNDIEVSSGAKIISFFPYITVHPQQFKTNKQIIHMGTARFLMMSGYTLKKVGYINKSLIQYGGDNDFTLSASRFYDIKTYIIRDAKCKLEDSVTGIKNQNINNLNELFMSFYSLKSPNNFRYRYILFKKFFGEIGAFLITTSMSLNTIVKFVIKKVI